MGFSWIQKRTWMLFACLSWMFMESIVAKPQYMVAIPGIIEAGAETKFCASLLKPNETLVMTVTLMSQETNTTLLTHTSSTDFHICTQFKAPFVQTEEVQMFTVEVKGDTFFSKEIKKVLIKVHQPITFIQTDKPIYLPGQTVHFRIVTLDTNLRPAKQLFNSIEIEDPNKNRIGQWLNQTSDSKILQLSYSLNSEAREGSYHIFVFTEEDEVSHNFKVEKNVLPKFEMTLNAKEEISITQGEIEAQVCAKYTYGQPVPGTVTVKVCRPLRYIYGTNITAEASKGAEITAPCQMETKQTDQKGCATFEFLMSAFTKIEQKALHDVMTVSAKIEEEGTGVSLQQEKRIMISYVIGRLSFIDTPTIYEKGTNLEGKVKAVYYNNTPIPDMPVYLFEGERWSPRRLQNLTTDRDGVTSFSLRTDDRNGDISFYASNEPILEYPIYRMPFYETGAHTASMSKGESSLEVKKIEKPLPCESEVEISIHYTVAGEAQGSVDITYLVLSSGVIAMQGFAQVEVQDKKVNKGIVSFKWRVAPEIAVDINVVAYTVLPSEKVMAHSADFTTEKCFGHKVSVEFTPSSAVPGEKINMQVMAQPGSLCGTSAIDQSVLIKEPGKTLEAEKIFDLLLARKVSYIPHKALDSTGCLSFKDFKSYRHDGNSAYSVFQNTGLKMATNLFIGVPSCFKRNGRVYHLGYDISFDHRIPAEDRIVARIQDEADVLAEGMVYEAVGPIIETVRTFFPETWIWDLVEVGDSGRKDVPLTVPDTITTWETEAFCLSPQGFGLAPRQKLTVFQPFFLELTMPYSIIRGEQFELKATVFNYLTSCIMMTVTPAPSADYALTPLSGDKYTSCLCGNKRKTVSWTMTPLTLGVVNVTVSAEAVASHASCDNEIVSVPDKGRIDVVTKTLIVKAEGTEVMKTHNWLLCPKEDALTDEIEVQLPANVINGSARGSVSVLGDILGRALKNLDGLLRMPYGCGEQNMALLAPNIYILQYLKGTQQLTPTTTEKATKFLSSGYQRQLNYKHDDGAYSTFGSGPGNTWLTAFVLRSFAKAQSFVYIDPTKIEESRTWLEHKQWENGCFEQSGKLFNNRMKGGVSDEVTLSAYITAAFLEMNRSAEDSVVKKSLSCLKESMSDLSNTYTTALLAYVFTLAGDMETRARLLQHLDTVAIRDEGYLHWSQSAVEMSASLSVEISSYVLLAKLSASPSAEDLGYASGIVRWLTGQQNYYGGFSSTQDTVVALQALALYSTVVFSPKGSSTVTVQSPSGLLTFNVNQDKLFYQDMMLEDVVGKYSLELTLTYNIPTPNEATTLSVKVKTEVNASKPHRYKLTLKLRSLYSGKESTTNMVILDIKVLSGFVPDPESLKTLRGALLVDRVDQMEDHVLVYIRELPKDIAINHSLTLIQEVPVQNLKPAVVKIYDYYQPSDQAETEYTFLGARA